MPTQALYWAIITMTSTGYGDIAPTTWFGKMVASGTTVFPVIFHHMIFEFLLLKILKFNSMIFPLSLITTFHYFNFLLFSLSQKNLAVILSIFDSSLMLWFGKMVASGNISGYISHHIFRVFIVLKMLQLKGSAI
jgi:hypothetical protein